MKIPVEFNPFATRHKNKTMVMAVLMGIAVGAWALFEKAILKIASDFFGSC